MPKIQIRYWDKNDDLICTHTLEDEWNVGNLKLWEKWMDDPNVEHPGEPPEWDGYDLAPVYQNDLEY